MANLRRTVSAYFVYILFSFLGMMTMSMFFRCVGSLARTITQTTVPFGVTVILLITYTGFIVPVHYMHSWIRWVRYLNPIAYTFESLMINEVSGSDVLLCSTNRTFSFVTVNFLVRSSYLKDQITMKQATIKRYAQFQVLFAGRILYMATSTLPIHSSSTKHICGGKYFSHGSITSRRVILTPIGTCGSCSYLCLAFLQFT